MDFSKNESIGTHGRYRTTRDIVAIETPIILWMIQQQKDPEEAARDIAEWVADRYERERNKEWVD